FRHGRRLRARARPARIGVRRPARSHSRGTGSGALLILVQMPDKGFAPGISPLRSGEGLGVTDERRQLFLRRLLNGEQRGRGASRRLLTVIGITGQWSLK